MMQVKHNKHELLEMIEQEGSQPLTPESIRNLDTLGGAYYALCRIHPDEAEEEHWEHKEHMGYAEHASNAGHMEPVKPAVHP